MFAEVMPIQQRLRDPGTVLAEGNGVISHTGYGFEHGCVVSRIMRCFSPAERSVAGNQDGGNGERIKMLETAGNGNAGVEDIIAADFFRGQLCGYGDRAVKVIRVSGSVGGNFKAGLGPGGGVFRM